MRAKGSKLDMDQKNYQAPLPPNNTEQAWSGKSEPIYQNSQQQSLQVAPSRPPVDPMAQPRMVVDPRFAQQASTVEPLPVQQGYTQFAQRQYNITPGQQPAVPQQQPMPESDILKTPAPRSTAKKVAIVITLLLVFIGVVGAVYFLFFNSSNSESTSQSANKSATMFQVTPLSTLSGVTLSLSSVPAGYTEQTSDLSDFKYYLSSDESCSIIYGTASAVEFPGADLSEIISSQIDILTSVDGVAANGPSEGDALVLASSEGGNQKYSMPTIEYEFSKDSNYATAYYSAAILQDDTRVIVNRSCSSSDGPVSSEDIQAVNGVAEQLVVNK